MGRLRKLSNKQAPPSMVEAALRVRPRLRAPERTFLHALDEHLGRQRDPRVAILVGSRPSQLRRLVETAHPDAQVLVLRVDQDVSTLHVALAGRGPFDAVVDDTRVRPGRVQRLQDFFFHLRPGGVFFVRNLQGSGKGDVWGFVSGLITNWAHIRDSPDGKGPRDRWALAHALKRVVLQGKHLELTNGVRTLVKMRDDEIDAVIGLRLSGRVLERRPPVEFTSRCTLRESSGHRDRRMVETYQVPAVSLRRYGDVICSPGQVAVQRNLLLPDTYRHHRYPRLTNGFTDEVAPRFANVKADLSRPKSLAGSYFWLDSEFPGHFGHAMTEQMSRLWAWDRAKQEFPELKALLALRPGNAELTEFELGIFEGAGVAEEDIVLLDGPTRVESLLAATPMLSHPNYIHPDLREMWGKVGRSLRSAAPDRQYPARIFCSRRVTKRSCHNSGEVETLFADHGFDVIYPEDLSFAEQARSFVEAEVVAGFAGSALFTLCFCDTPKRAIMISPESYTARNEYMIASVLGHRLDVAWSRPDVPHPESGWDHAAFESDFRFDFDREGTFLKQVLTSL